MNRDEVITELRERMQRGASAEEVLDWLDSIGYQGEALEPPYAEASMAAIASSLATFYNTLRLANVPDYVASQLTQTFMNNTQRAQPDTSS